MPCVHLKQLFQLCQENELKVSSGELIHFVCEKCNQHEVCPTNLMDDEAFDDEPAAAADGDAKPETTADSSTSQGS